ncbi:MAG TPA: hypothetical protein VHH73_18480 [Verrucomicrobiae bacterium]|nr:hypothetical protein [Verrucomicrobiae bacterium]
MTDRFAKRRWYFVCAPVIAILLARAAIGRRDSTQVRDARYWQKRLSLPATREVAWFRLSEMGVEALPFLAGQLVGDGPDNGLPANAGLLSFSGGAARAQWETGVLVQSILRDLAAAGPGATGALPILKPLLQRESFPFRMAVAKAIWETSCRADLVLPFLEHEICTCVSGRAKEAMRLLATMEREAAPTVPQLIRLLAHQDVMVARQAAETLGAIGPAARAALPAMHEAAFAKDKRLAVTAQAAIEQVEGQIAPMVDDEPFRIDFRQNKLW